MKPSIVYLDIESQKTIAQAGGDWSKLHRMKLAVAVAWCEPAGELRIFTERDIKELAALLRSASLVIGYNLLRFDIPIIKGYRGVNLTGVRCRDLLVDIAEQTEERHSLASLLKVNFGLEAKASGLECIEWWQEGQVAKVVETCANDVLHIRRLHLSGAKQGFVCVPGAAKQRKRCPVDWRVDNPSR